MKERPSDSEYLRRHSAKYLMDKIPMDGYHLWILIIINRTCLTLYCPMNSEVTKPSDQENIDLPAIKNSPMLNFIVQ